MEEFEKRCCRSVRHRSAYTQFQVTLAQPVLLNDVFTSNVRACIYMWCIKYTAPRLWRRALTHCMHNLYGDTLTHVGTQGACIYHPLSAPRARASWIVPLPSWTSFRVNNAGRTTTILRAHPSSIFHTFYYITRNTRRIRIRELFRMEIESIVRFLVRWSPSFVTSR